MTKIKIMEGASVSGSLLAGIAQQIASKINGWGVSDECYKSTLELNQRIQAETGNDQLQAAKLMDQLLQELPGDEPVEYSGKLEVAMEEYDIALRSKSAEDVMNNTGSPPQPTQATYPAGIYNVPVTILKAAAVEIRFRKQQDLATVEEYAEAIDSGNFPPLVLFIGEQGKMWLADGLNRVLAAEIKGLASLKTDVRHAPREEAIKFGLQANADHGLRRSNDDKRHCVALATKEFADLNDQAIADLCRVSREMVRGIRNEFAKFANSATPSTATVVDAAPVVTQRKGQDGKVYPTKKSPHKKAAAESVALCASKPVPEEPSTAQKPEPDYVEAHQLLRRVHQCCGAVDAVLDEKLRELIAYLQSKINGRRDGN